MHLTESQFKQELAQQDDPVLLFFVSETCAPSYAMQMLMDELDLSVRVAEIDIEKSPAIGMHYKIRGTPLLMLTHKSEPIASRIGTQTHEQVEEWIEKSLDKLNGRK